VFRIALVRHGESVGNAEERLQGHEDYPLSSRGRDQVRALARRWQDEGVEFDRIISSPLSRAVETARILSETLGAADDLEIDRLWIEQDAGRHAGQRWNDIDGAASLAGCGTRALEGAPGSPFALSPESDAALSARARRALDAILDREPARYLVVSHRAFLNAALWAILDVPSPQDDDARRTTFRIANASFARVRFYAAVRRWQIDVIGDRTHWRDAE
jgi:broad specificity phosphatase PhoE